MRSSISVPIAPPIVAPVLPPASPSVVQYWSSQISIRTLKAKNRKRKTHPMTLGLPHAVGRDCDMVR
jgi:hypothetical protein